MEKKTLFGVEMGNCSRTVILNDQHPLVWLKLSFTYEKALIKLKTGNTIMCGWWFKLVEDITMHVVVCITFLHKLVCIPRKKKSHGIDFVN